MFECDICGIAFNSFIEAQKHYRLKHKHDTRFLVRCNIGTCSYSTKKWESFRSHVRRKHGDNQENRVDENENDMLEDNAEIGADGNDNLEDNDISIEHECTIYALKLESKYNLSQNAVDAIVHTTSDLIDNNSSYVYNVVKEKLAEQGVDSSFLDDIPKQAPFAGLKTQRTRDKRYDKLSLYVKPKEVVLQTFLRWSRNKFKFAKKTGSYVPFRESLGAYLSMPEVLHHVEHSHFSPDEVKRDIVDGSSVLTH